MPHDWLSGRVKSVSFRVTDGAHISPDTDGGAFPFVSTRDVTQGVIDFDGALKTSQKTYEYMVKTGCQPKAGDVLFSKDGTVGETVVVREDRDFVVASSLVIVTPDPQRMDSRFLAHVFSAKTSRDAASSMMRGTGLPRLSVANLARLEVPIPPLPAQRWIVAYLDRETAQIDTLIAKQEQLIATLLERRASSIAGATGWASVTQAIWPMKRLSWLFLETGSGTTPAPKDIVEPGAGTVPWVTTGELRESIITSTKAAVRSESLRDYSALKVHPSGSLLIAMYGATIGRLAMLGVDATSNQACCALVTPRDCMPEFVRYSLMAARQWLILEAAGGGQPNINQDKIRSFRVPTPPLSEQEAIVVHLDEQTAKIDLLIEKAERFIDLSKERRSALITAVVTGQLPVATAMSE